jgi:hypothetical protein
MKTPLTEEQLRDGAFAGAVALDTALNLLRERDTALDDVMKWRDLATQLADELRNERWLVDSQRSLINTIDDLKRKEAQ